MLCAYTVYIHKILYTDILKQIHEILERISERRVRSTATFTKQDSLCVLVLSCPAVPRTRGEPRKGIRRETNCPASRNVGAFRPAGTKRWTRAATRSSAFSGVVPIARPARDVAPSRGRRSTGTPSLRIVGQYFPRVVGNAGSTGEHKMAAGRNDRPFA